MKEWRTCNGDTVFYKGCIWNGMDPTTQLILKLEKSSWAKLKDNSRRPWAAWYKLNINSTVWQNHP